MRLIWLYNSRLLFGIVILAIFIVAIACSDKAILSSSESFTSHGNQRSIIAPAAPFIPHARAVPPITHESHERYARVLVARVGNGKFDPVLAESADLNFQRIFQTAMIGGKGGGVLTPSVVRDWSVSDDGKVWTFTVNEGFIKDHEGNIITRDDVYFNLDSRLGTEAQALVESNYYQSSDVIFSRLVDSVEKGPDSDQVSVTLNTLVMDFPRSWSENAHNADSMIVSEKAMRDRVGDNGFEGYESAPIGIGPMRMTGYIDKRLYEFEKFEDFFWHPENGYDEDRRVAFDTLDLEVVPDPVTRFASTKSGYTQLSETNINLVDYLYSHDEIRVIWQNEAFYNWVVYAGCWNESVWCYHKEVRQAAEYALDNDAMINRLYNTKIFNFDSWAHVTPNSLGWSENLHPRAYDVNHAKKLLRSVGFGGADGGDGTDANGEQVYFAIYTWKTPDMPLLPYVAQAYSDLWSDGLGWEVDVIIGDAHTGKQSWHNREYYGNVLMHINKTRFDGDSIMRDAFMNSDIAWQAIDNSTQEPWENSTTPVVVEMGLSDFNNKTRHQSYNKMYAYLRDQAYWGNGFNANVPWFIDGSVISYNPWKLTPYLTAIWTLKLK